MLPGDITAPDGEVPASDCKKCHNDPEIADLNCTKCHGFQIHNSTMLQKSDHNDVHTIPNPNCTDCHDIDGAAARWVDLAAMNDTANNYTHEHLNAEATKPTDVRVENKWCWACHGVVNATTGHASYADQPEEGHPANYAHPRNCTDCHYNQNSSTNFSAPQTWAHTWYTWEIVEQGPVCTTAVDACTDCHAQDEVIFSNNDTDWGDTVADVDNDGVKGGNKSAYHYESIHTYLKSVIGTVKYCGYCHQNSSTAFSGAFADPENMYRSDHNPMDHENPNCTNTHCHGPFETHQKGLYNPIWYTAENCSECHVEADHNDELNCTECHMEKVPADIHPIKFLQEDGETYLATYLTGVNCEDCHFEGGSAEDWLVERGHTAKKITHQHHSHDEINGSKWNATAYWNQ